MILRVSLIYPPYKGQILIFRVTSPLDPLVMMLRYFSPNNKFIEENVTPQTVMGSALQDSLYMIKMFYLDLSYHMIISIIQNSLSDPNVCLHTHMISLTIISCGILSPKLLEVIGGQGQVNFEKGTQETHFWLSLTHIGDSMLTTKVIREVTRGPKEVKKRSNLKNAPGIQCLAYINILYS